MNRTQRCGIIIVPDRVIITYVVDANTIERVCSRMIFQEKPMTNTRFADRERNI